VLKSPVGLGSVYSGLNQTKYFLAMWVVADHLRGPVQWRQFVRGIAIGLALHAAISVLQMVTGGALQVPGIKASTQQTLSYAGAGLLEVFRPSGLLSHPNALADYLVMIIPAMLGMALLGRRHVPGRYAGWLAALAAAFLMMLLTLSRGGWVATTAGVAVYLVLGYLRGTVTKAHLRRVGIAGLVGMIFAVAAFPTVWLRLFEADNRSTQSRLLLAEQALLIVQRNPIDGVGLGAYTWAAQRNLPDSYGRVPESFRDMLLKGVVHNKYLLTAAETGIIGLLLFLNVFRRSMSALWRADFRADPVREVVALGTLSGLVAVLVTFIVEHSYLGVPIETAWVAMGAAAALTTRQPAPAQSAVAARSR
jgi:O-antigen ligase